MKAFAELAADFGAEGTASGRFRLAGRPVFLEAAEPELYAELSRPLAHLAADSDEPPCLRISARRGPAHAFAPARPDWEFDYEGGRLAGSADGRYIGYFRPDLASWLDRASGRLLACYGELLLHERTKPLAALLSVWLGGLGVQVVHAGMVGWQGRGVLLAGPSGAGKSTVAIACAEAGFDFLGDDYVGLGEEGTGHSLYSCCRLHREDRFPALSKALVSGEDKDLLDLGRCLPEALRPGLPIESVVFPRVTGGPPALSPIPRSQALLRLAYSSLRIPAGKPQTAMHRMARLVAARDCWWLDLGPDHRPVPDLLRGLVS